MHALLTQLQKDHANYARLLNLLEIQLISMEAGKDVDFRRMRDIMKYMMNYPDVFHHPGEEILFDLARKRDIPRKARADLDRLHAEHALLAELGGQLEDLLKAAVSGNIVSRATLLREGSRYVECMRSHMRLEEREVFPMLDGSLRGPDWVDAEARFEQVPDPVFGKTVAEEYRLLYDSITNPAPA